MSGRSAADAFFSEDESAESVTWDVTIPTDDDSILRRRRASSPIKVLYDIDNNKQRYGGDFWGDYDLFSICLSVIDQVALAMGISAGRTWDEIMEYAMSQARRQSPTGGEQQWRDVAERVVVSLVTTDAESVNYIAYQDSSPEWLSQKVRILYVNASGEEGTEYLRASEQAINIFLDALDLDIEEAQIANEAQLRVLIERGSVASAVKLARMARYHSIQYQERIQRIVKDTLIDPEAHDWIGDVPKLLDSALDHVRDRLAAEAAIRESVAESRSNMGDTRSLMHANQLIEILRDCRRRHDELHNHLIGARGRWREALDDRLSRPPSAAHRVRVYTDLLVPLLERTARNAGAATDRLLGRFGGIQTRWWPSLTTMTDELFTPPRPPEAGEEFSEPEFDDDDEAQWWESYESTVDSLFGGISEPVRLSQLLVRADSIAETVYDDEGEPLDRQLLKAAIVHAAHRAWATHLAGRPVGERVLLAVATGEYIDDETLFSDDLILVIGEVIDDIDEDARPDRGTAAGVELDTDQEESVA